MLALAKAVDVVVRNSGARFGLNTRWWHVGHQACTSVQARNGKVPFLLFYYQNICFNLAGSSVRRSMLF